MMRTGLTALLSHWRRNPIQLFTLLAGLALATALWSGVQAVNSEARASYDVAAETLGEGLFSQIVRNDGAQIDQTTYIAMRRAGWLVSPAIDQRLVWPEGSLRLIGIDPLTAPGTLAGVALDDRANISDFIAGDGVIYAHPETADLARARLGRTVIAAPDLATGTALTDISVALQIMDRGPVFDRVIVSGAQASGHQPLAEIDPSLSLRAPSSQTDVARLTDSFHLNLTAFGLLSFAVGIFIVNGAIGLAFEQRRSVFRTLRALGLPLRQLILLLLIELLAFAVTAGAIGVFLGYLIAAALLPDVAATLRGLYGAEVTGTLSLRPSWWLSGMAIAVGGTGLAAMGALLKLARLPLLASAQPRAWAHAASRNARVQGAIAVALLGTAFVIANVGSGLVAGFALLGALLIGAALALPLLLDRALALGASLSKSVIAQWFWADTRQQLPGLSLALMALLLAMAANVGVSTMVSSFRLTFVGFLDQRLASELYVRVDTAAQADSVESYLTPRVDAVLPILSADIEIAGQSGQVFGARDHATYRENWGLLDAAPNAWDRIAAGQGVLLNEQTARRSMLGIDDTLTIAGKQLSIVGIYSDYGNPSAQAFITEPLFKTLFPDVSATRFGVRTTTANELAQDLRTDMGLSDDNLVNQAQIKRISLDVFERTFTVTGALNILTLSVAGFAILMSLLTLAAMRLPQLAPVWSLGLTRRALGRYELLRALLLATLTTLAAIPLGLILAWVLLAIINVEAFGWKLPMFVFPADYARLAFFALIAAALAALWPARKLATTPPSTLLKVFSNER